MAHDLPQIHGVQYLGAALSERRAIQTGSWAAFQRIVTAPKFLEGMIVHVPV